MPHDADQADCLLLRPALLQTGGTLRMRRDRGAVVCTVCIVRQFFSYKKICRQCLSPRLSGPSGEALKAPEGTFSLRDRSWRSVVKACQNA